MLTEKYRMVSGYFQTHIYILMIQNCKNVVSNLQMGGGGSPLLTIICLNEMLFFLSMPAKIKRNQKRRRLKKMLLSYQAGRNCTNLWNNATLDSKHFQSYKEIPQSMQLSRLQTSPSR